MALVKKEGEPQSWFVIVPVEIVLAHDENRLDAALLIRRLFEEGNLPVEEGYLLDDNGKQWELKSR